MYINIVDNYVCFIFRVIYNGGFYELWIKNRIVLEKYMYFSLFGCL